MNSIKGPGKLLLWVGIAVMLGCGPSENELGCEQGECEEGSECVQHKTVSMCEWGKIDPETGLIVPDVRMRLVEPPLPTRTRTNKSSFNFEVVAYGAPDGLDGVHFYNDKKKSVSPCVEKSVDKNGERRRSVCSIEATDEGDHRLEVVGRGVNGATVTVFEWIYDKTPPRADMQLLTAQTEYKRDAELTVGLKAEAGSEDIDWGRTEVLYANNRFAMHVACPESFPESFKGSVRCFKLSLNEVPDLPHGKYSLPLKARLVDTAGNVDDKNVQYPLNITYVLWQANGAASPHQLVATDNTVVVSSADALLEGLSLKTGASSWSELAVRQREGDDFTLMVGNHLGTHVLVKTCSSGNSGLQALDMNTGVALTPCTAFVNKTLGVALLQGSSTQRMEVLRGAQEDGATALETCYLTGSMGPNMDFACHKSAEGVLMTKSPLLVHPQGAETTVYFATDYRWFILRMNGKTDRSEIDDVLGKSPPTALSKNLLCGKDWIWPLDETGKAATFLPQQLTGNLWGIDSGDAPMVSSGSQLIRYSRQGEPSQAKEPTTWPHKAGFLLEGGDILLAGDGGVVALLNSAFDRRWEHKFFEGVGELRQAILVPLSESPPRSVLVMEMVKKGNQVVYGSVLLDTPGLKTGTWSMEGHDVCRSSNTNMPRQCWKGLDGVRFIR